MPEMERKLRIQLTVSVAVALVVMLGFIILLTSAIRARQMDATADSVLEVVLDYEGSVPESLRKLPDDAHATVEDVFDAQYFVMYVDADGTVAKSNLDGIATVQDRQAAELARQVLSRWETGGPSRERGNIGSFRYLVREQDDGSLAIGFLDRAAESGSNRTSILSVSLISFGVTVGVTLLFALLSKRIVEPIVRSQQVQRQFVVDAGHDLRTPVSIISADADVLAMDIGADNEWLQDIKTQVSVMSQLTESLIVLTRASGSIQRDNSVDVGELVQDTVGAFRSRSLTEGHELVLEKIEKGVQLRGNRQYLTRMVGALVDNALKYSSEGAPICVAVEKHVRQVEIRVSNAVDDVDPAEVRHWFERFYQSDKSRNHDAGGFGIGLAMVRAVAEAHGGKAKAVASPGRDAVTFSVSLPLPVRKVVTHE